MRLKEGIETLMAQKSLNSQICKELISDLLEPDSHPFQKVAFLVLLRSKTETADELVGMVSALIEKMLPLRLNRKTLDIVGTGGDRARTVNISTGSAILAAACGVAIVKHGNAAVTSLAGSADVLKALGVNIDLAPEKIIQGKITKLIAHIIQSLNVKVEMFLFVFESGYDAFFKAHLFVACMGIK